MQHLYIQIKGGRKTKLNQIRAWNSVGLQDIFLTNVTVIIEHICKRSVHCVFMHNKVESCLCTLNSAVPESELFGIG